MYFVAERYFKRQKTLVDIGFVGWRWWTGCGSDDLSSIQIQKWLNIQSEKQATKSQAGPLLQKKKKTYLDAEVSTNHLYFTFAFEQ